MKNICCVFLFLTFIGCNKPERSQTSQDSTAIADSLELAEFNNESHEAVDADTALLNDVKSKFNKAQIDAKVAYQYRKGGLLVFASLTDTLQAIEVIPYGTRITLAENLINNQPSDKVIFEGLKGRYVKLEGADKYVFSGYLTNFPFPKDDEGFYDYCRNNFHLTTVPVQITSKVVVDGEESTPEWYKTKYRFEAGIDVDDDGYYEGASTSVTLPASCTMQEGFLLLKSFATASTLDSAFYSYPGGAYTKEIRRSVNAIVEANESGIRKIYISDEGGCIDETYVEKVEGRIVIGKGGGC